MSRAAFTARQAEILGLVALGLTDKEVAMRLGVTYRTVRTHLERMFRRHGFRCRAEAVVAWMVQMRSSAAKPEQRDIAAHVARMRMGS